MEALDKIIRDKNKLLAMAGIMQGQKAFVGPEVLHIDLTNWCNFNCVACWCRSPLLGDKAMPEWEKKLILPLETIKGTFDDLADLGGLRQVKLVGGGEPFMHPNILEIVEYIKAKDKNIEIDINTNFSLVDKEKVNKLLELGVDSLTISIWAGSAQTWLAVHPNQEEQTFWRIRENMEFIAHRRKQLNVRHPRMIIHNVVFNLNYRDVGQMVKFGLDVGADDIQFVPVDTVKGKTEQLLPGDEEKKELLGQLYKLRELYDPRSFRYVAEDGRMIVLSDFCGFIRRIEEQNIASGAYDEGVVGEIPCYVGWLFARVMTTGDVVPCCKGHRMSMGNIQKQRFKEIWLCGTYDEFRHNGLNLAKSDPYFSRIGNDAAAQTGCYNCDNLWQNIPMHKRIGQFIDKNNKPTSFFTSLLKEII
jgi:MoaA/NifB/PqqE/SkfB family radical SAM enzyme